MEHEAAVAPAVDVILDYASRVNFAFQQNAIPVVRRIEVRNFSDVDLHDVVCRFVPSPEWAKPFEHRIALIPAQSDFTLADVPVELNLNYLASLSDRVRGEIQLEVTAANEPKGPAGRVFTRVLPVEVYAFDEWTGLVSLPEILAAFVTPNVAVVEQLLSRASDFLLEATGSGALDAYQPKSKKRVYEILACLYRAVCEQGIRYSNPPASFETSGQRVRFCEQILRSKLATCLDLCLLFAALIEQSGLRPLLLLHKGHAYLGCWLIEETLPEPTSDDLQSIRKRVELEEILLFETTLACEDNRGDFGAAVAGAARHLHEDSIFQYAIDIHASRASGIRPLPLARETDRIDLASAAEAPEPSPVAFPETIRVRDFAERIEVAPETLTPAGRVDHWKQQLLDLTLRNRLLNFRETKQTVPLICPEPEHLEDQLATDQTFQIKEQTKLMAGLDPRSLVLQERQSGEDPVKIHLTEELRAKRLRSSLTGTELSRRLLDLYRRTRMEMEESGANTLYLALGFLEWKETPESDRSHRAPILLIPVRLDRKSVQQGFSLNRYDEDPAINVTLLELLKRDFELEIPGVNPPPEDDVGVDVEKVFRLFQQAVKEMRGWEVHREVWLAHFSFNKFLLWKDLNDRADLLAHNPVVDHLVNKPGEPFIDEVEDVREEELDDRISYTEMFCPVSADSSQLAAVIAASKEKNLVLYGPPGTGKSQTITNLIAHCLALGKRVLFVAEKRAALEVVHRRLSQIGLGPFCLELHSNKSGKADVLRQFGEALDFASRRAPAEWERLANKLEAARAELNGFVRELHQVYPNGLSAYRVYSWLIAHASETKRFADLDPLRIDAIESQSREQFEALQQLCDDLQLRGRENRLSREAKEALRPFRASSWKPDWQDQALAATADLERTTEAMATAVSELDETLGVDAGPASNEELAALAELCQQLIDAPALPADFVQATNWPAFREEAEEWIAVGRKRDEARDTLTGFNLDSVLTLNLPGLIEKHNALMSGSNPGLFNRIRAWFLLKPVRQARADGAPAWKSDDAPEFFVAATELQRTQNTLTEANEGATERFGDFWNSGEADWDRIGELLTFGDNLQNLISRIAGENVDRLLEIRAKIGRLLPVAPEMLGSEKAVGTKLAAAWDAWKALGASETHFGEILQVDSAALPKEGGHLDMLCDLAARIQTHQDSLQNWCRWQDSRQQAEVAQLQPLLEAVDGGILPLKELREAFEWTYRQNFIRRLLNLSDPLRDFWGDEQQQRIAAFNELDTQYTDLTARAVVARLANELPRARGEDCPRNTELGILQRERTKKARHKPVRKLLQETSSIVPKLKPCFLMSPLSVAQYLDPGQNDFDIVVFDEASQIPVWDAIGAIARGTQVVIVGDPKQLPPTNFFGRAESDEEAIDEGSVRDLESILDECLASGLQTYNLRWHYRSRREGLITFSNRHYYENRLQTFPSPHAADVGVRLVPVPDGYYDKGKSRTNLAEAEAITREVVRRLTDPGLSEQSIGIVTFSQAQQTLILDLLDEARRNHPEMEAHFGEEIDEPVFVKNLENVQGDERDVILFSICYGPDQAGRLSMNFGPLNRVGGERRLNVAITRAKQEIIVFSTLRSDEIDLARTRAKGVEHLKSYLEYAERGPRALAAVDASTQPETHAAVFEGEVAEFLEENGFEVHRRIGCSGYRIDLAIVAPDDPGQYVLGIECDGATYRDAATARDRDRLRQFVLKGLGWQTHRVWSTDWWRDRAKAGQQLLEVVNEAVQAFTSAKVAHASRMSPSADAPEAEREGSKSESVGYEFRDDATSEVNEAAPTDNEAAVIEYADETAERAFKNRAVDYPDATLIRQGSQEAFYEPEGQTILKSQIRRIIEKEGPITETLLLRRVTAEWGFSRTGQRIRDIIMECLPMELAKSSQRNEAVYWPDELSPSDYRHYRIPTEQPESRRKIQEIPIEEIKNAALDILERYLSYPRDEFAREVARKFACNRLSETAVSILETMIGQLIESGHAVPEDGSLKFRE